MTYSLDGRRIVITGASRGIGAALARSIAPRAAELLLVARSRPDLERLAAELPCPVTLQVRDLSREDDLQALGDALVEAAPDVLVNNAGIGRWGRFAELAPLHLETMLALNVRAVTVLTHRLLPLLVARGSGAILNVGSTAGLQGTPFMALYGATKAFVNGFTEGLAWELRGTGVSATCLLPGSTRTDFFRAGEIPAERMIKLLEDPERVARAAWRALERGQPRRVSGAAHRLLSTLQGFVPRWVVGRIAYRVFTPATTLGDGVPEEGVPDAAAPDAAAPDDGVPDDGVPDDGVPADGAPGDGCR